MSIRLSDEAKAEIDEWAARQEDMPPRSVAVRLLIDLALKSQRTPKNAAKAAMKQRSLDRWAARITDLTWRQRFENLMRAAVRGSEEPEVFDGLPIRGPRGNDYVAEEVRELFGIKWKGGRIVGTLTDEETSLAPAKPRRPAKRKDAE